MYTLLDSIRENLYVASSCVVSCRVMLCYVMTRGVTKCCRWLSRKACRLVLFDLVEIEHALSSLSQSLERKGASRALPCDTWTPSRVALTFSCMWPALALAGPRIGGQWGRACLHAKLRICGQWACTWLRAHSSPCKFPPWVALASSPFWMAPVSRFLRSSLKWVTSSVLI